MRICRFGSGRLGVVRDGQVHDVTHVAADLGPFHYPLPTYDVFVARLQEIRPALESAADKTPGVPIGELSLLSPVANPGKLVAAPVNYLKHLDEARSDKGIHFQNQIGEIRRVGLFLKATSSLIGQADSVALRFADRRNDHEIELAAIIGRTANRVSAGDALDYVAAYSVGLDMTVRGPEERSMRKSIDTFSVLGPIIVTADEFGDPGGVELELTVNGEVRQKANTRDLVLSVPELIEYASRYYTLHPGDVIYTGTPEGVGEVRDGDVIKATIDRIGTLEVTVSSAKATQSASTPST
jgi:2-keto-4-pentenoate hydratase/2-oxohepta-3-ene-1,7-dioic acid hydratase in catechol pathway